MNKISFRVKVEYIGYLIEMSKVNFENSSWKEQDVYWYGMDFAQYWKTSLNINNSEFKEIKNELVNNYNANNCFNLAYINRLYWNNKIDAQKAIEYLESIVVLKKLSEI